jgi:hypothetical protein
MTLSSVAVTGDPTFEAASYIDVIYQQPKHTSIGFVNESAQEVVLRGWQGHNVYGGGTDAKVTRMAQRLAHTAWDAGQRMGQFIYGRYYGMGDCYVSNWNMHYACGPNAGDEGQSYTPVQYCNQVETKSIFTISAAPASATINTTTTQVITASPNSQTVNVVSSAGVIAGQWVVVEQSMADGFENLEAVEVTAVPSGTSITGIFLNHHPSGVTVTPAKVLDISDGSFVGEQRVVVNLSATPKTSGTVTTSAGGSLTGSTNANWASTMVGGSSVNIGAIALAKDQYRGPPYNTSTNSSDPTGPLDSWYQITTVTASNALSIHSFSVAGDTSYRGKGSFPTTYTIRPAMRILQLRNQGNTIICERTTHTWSVGDTLECVVCPYPDVATGFHLSYANWTAGGTLRSGLTVENRGARTFETGITVQAQPASPIALGSTTADNLGFTTGISVGAGLALNVVGHTGAMLCNVDVLSTTSSAINGSKIAWGGDLVTQRIESHPDALGMRWRGISVGDQGELTFHSNSGWGTSSNRSGSLENTELRYTGNMGLVANTANEDTWLQYRGEGSTDLYWRVRGAWSSLAQTHSQKGIAIEKVQRNSTAAVTVTSHFVVDGLATRVRAIPFELETISSEPAAPLATGVYLYTVVSSGKTVLYAKFDSGAAQVVATEP